MRSREEGAKVLTGSRAVRFAARLLLGGVFIYASLDKIAQPEEFAKIVMNYGILPVEPAIYFAYLLPWVEMILGIFLVAGLFVRESALALSSLLLVFMAAIVIRSLNGPLENCGCFSVTGSGSGGGIVSLLLKDVLLLVLGTWLYFTKSLKKRLRLASEP